jgi:hypothetical protein
LNKSASLTPCLNAQEEPKPALSHENVVINELIREYLEYNHYKHTLSVLIPESGQPLDRIDRAYLAQELNMREDRTSRQETLACIVLQNTFTRKRSFSFYYLNSSKEATLWCRIHPCNTP